MGDTVDTIAGYYGTSRRQLTIGQIEDFFLEKIREREEEKRENEERKVDKERSNKREIEVDKENNNICANFIDKQQIEGEFERLWNRYPRKIGKKDALRHYSSARKKGVSYSIVSEGIDRYNSYIKRNGVNPNFVKYGSSWFCDWGWENDYSETFTDNKQPKPRGFHNFDERNTDYNELFGVDEFWKPSKGNGEGTELDTVQVGGDT